MGGFGSGRKGSKRLTTHMLSMDIRTLARRGLLNPGYFSLTWKRSDGQETGNIGIKAETDRLHLSYKYRHPEEEWLPIEAVVEFDWTPCHFGGRRPWFRCPSCGRQCAIIYGGKYFSCRSCHNLAFPSENENPIDRLYRKAWKLREILEAPRDLTRPILHKPRGMHWLTFERLTNKAHELEMQIFSEMDRHPGLF